MRPATPIAWRRRESRRLVKEAAKNVVALAREQFRHLAAERGRLKWDTLASSPERDEARQ